MNMPVSGVPKCLEALMGTLFGSMNVQGWQIYKENRSENVTLRIRFSDHNGGLSEGVTPCSYKKKSNTQASRDRKRAMDFKSKTDCGVKTRSMMRSTEKPRSTVLNSDIISDNQPVSHMNDFQELSLANISVSTCHTADCDDPERQPISDHKHDLDTSHISVGAKVNSGVLDPIVPLFSPNTYSVTQSPPLLQMEHEPTSVTHQEDDILVQETSSTSDSECDYSSHSECEDNDTDSVSNCDKSELIREFQKQVEEIESQFVNMSASLRNIDRHIDHNANT